MLAFRTRAPLVTPRPAASPRPVRARTSTVAHSGRTVLTKPRQQPTHRLRHPAAAARAVRRHVTMQPSAKLNIVVTGAGGRTGGLVVDQLLADPSKWGVTAVGRSAKSLASAGARGAATAVVDVTAPGAEAALTAAMDGAYAVIICTSAVPQIKKRSIVKLALAKLFRRQGVRPEFRWKGAEPRLADWEGQRAQIDAAIAAGVRRVVLVSSMGVTQPDNMLNAIGDGKILLYKRKAEEYLVARRDRVEHCIIHPGGLIDAPGGEREVVLGVDDTLLAGTVRSIPRADVASLAIAAATSPAAAAASIDCVAKPPGEGVATTDYQKLLADFKGKTAAYAPLAEMAALA